MKKIALFSLAIGMLAVSCSKKNNGPDAKPPVKPPVISSVRFANSTSTRIYIDSFEYDSQSRLIKYDLFNVDTLSPDYSHPAVLTLHYNGNDSLPATATDDWSGSTQYFTWNSQGKLQQDSTDQIMYNYSYDADRLFVAQSPVSIPKMDQDTMQFQNNNLIRRYYWSFYSPTDIRVIDYDFTYSTIANPLYDPQHLGVVLYMERGKSLDYVSSQLPVTILNGSFSASYTWTVTDGKVVSGTETGTYSPTYHGYYTFRYL